MESVKPGRESSLENIILPPKRGLSNIAFGAVSMTYVVALQPAMVRVLSEQVVDSVFGG